MLRIRDPAVGWPSCNATRDGIVLLCLAYSSSVQTSNREYEEFKFRINGLVATAQKVPEDGWTMQDGTPWPGNNVETILVFLGHDGLQDIEGNELPNLVYVSREKRPGFDHHKKAGALNALGFNYHIECSFLLNVDCDHYINNSKALREAMCFLMDPTSERKSSYVQFPQRFDGIDRHDRYSNRNVVFFDINMKGLDGIQGPIYVSTGCVFRRHALYRYDAPAKKKRPSKTCNCWPKFEMTNLCCIAEANVDSRLASQVKLEKKFGQSPIFVASTLLENGGLPNEASTSSLLKLAGFMALSRRYLDWIQDALLWMEISNYACIIFISLFISIAATGILEMQWGDVGIDDWWRNEQFWVIGGASSHFFALFQGLLKVLAGVETSFTVTSKAGDDAAFSELYIFKWTSLLIPPMTLLIINIVGVVVGISDAINNGYDSWGPLFGRLFFALWVIIHLYPFLKGLMGKKERTPTIVVVWSILLALILTLLWVRVNPFVSHDGPFLIVCGLNCDD
ncbi:hypothetical protein RND71_025124 [Anisodus tanguticus]|uniref:Uncharacterized protein n=1 Tax=Anisodus tanguticus TaxID=243964 RepID=A0AAE1V4J7_9SOLA|nr:hypothetical protein RND71_025124 [Anisodus tanguticus]